MKLSAGADTEGFEVPMSRALRFGDQVLTPARYALLSVTRRAVTIPENWRRFSHVNGERGSCEASRTGGLRSVGQTGAVWRRDTV